MTATEAELRAFVVDAQADAWDRLDKALRAAINGVWSMGAEGEAQHIVRAARLVGPTPWGQVQWPLVRGGVYEAVLTAGGLPAVVPDEAETAGFDALMEQHVPVVGDAAVARYEATVRLLRSPAAAKWFTEGDD